MRHDAVGIFWQEEPVVKVKKEKIKRTPPERTWESPEHLPFIDEARAFDVPMLSDQDLITLSEYWLRQEPKEQFVFDIESYPNYFLIAFKNLSTGKIIYFEAHDNDVVPAADLAKLEWLMKTFTLISFNGINYDIPIATLAIHKFSAARLKEATNLIIQGDGLGEPLRPYEVYRKYKVKQLRDIDHIDVMEVAPLDGSLKIYSGRLHCPRIQDLPYPPETVLTPEQKLVVRWYCVNDLNNTELVYKDLEKAIQLRDDMGKMYGVDLRSKSDAQIAEAVISKELERITGLSNFKAPNYVDMVGQKHKYDIPSFIQYQTPNMQWVLNLVRNAVFVVAESGRIAMPDELKGLDIPIGKGIYRMGIGGLHSSEESVAHRSDDKYVIKDRDVASYYPRVILNQQLYPQHLGVGFLTVYQSIVDRRLEAKRSGDKLIAETLKITVNGSFGKTGNRYSMLYEPRLVIQTTITGQLSLLMLIERLELAGFEVLSANTDGIVTKVLRVREERFDSMLKQWEADTGFETEEAKYLALYSRDVNNYIAIKDDPTIKDDSKRVKLKGAYGETNLKKNPQNEICNEAVIALLLHGTPIDATVRQCKDIRKFVTLRKVRGGAVKDGKYLGSTVRWYHTKDPQGEIIYAMSGNRVAMSDGVSPLQDLPDTLPDDVDFDWYIEEAYNILRDIGYLA